MHIFKAGTHALDDFGGTATVSRDDLLKCAEIYSPATHEAPIVVGHPKTDAPAYGWIKQLSVVGDNLFGQPQQVNPTFAEMVRAGSFKKISVSFYSPSAPTNPVPGNYYLKHVGFLGANPPVVKGLQQVEFAENAEGILTLDFGELNFADRWMDNLFVSTFRGLREFLIDQFGMDAADKVVSSWMLEDLQRELGRQQVTPEEQTVMGFSEISGGGSAAPKSENPAPKNPNPNGDSMSDNNETKTTDFAEREANLKSQEAALKAREIALSRAEYVNFAEGLVAAGKLLPAQKTKAVELLCALSVSPDTVSFGEGENKFEGSVKDLFKGFLEGQPKVVDYSERAPGGSAVPDLATDPVRLAKRITEYRNAEMAKGRTISFAEAHQEVLAE